MKYLVCWPHYGCKYSCELLPSALDISSNISLQQKTLKAKTEGAPILYFHFSLYSSLLKLLNELLRIYIYIFVSYSGQ